MASSNYKYISLTMGRTSLVVRLSLPSTIASWACLNLGNIPHMHKLSFLVWVLTAVVNAPFVHSHHQPGLGHDHHHAHLQIPLSDFSKSQSDPTRSPTWLEKYGNPIDLPFSGPLSFSHLPYSQCLADESTSFDIALLGLPFDTGVSYRPGARFGPYAIRSGSRRQRDLRGFSLAWKNNPYSLGAKIVDCGDVRFDRTLQALVQGPHRWCHLQVPVNPFDNALAVDQMEVAYSTLLARTPATPSEGSDDAAAVTQKFSKDGKAHPRIVR